jgi:hypothetical protein
MAKFKQLFFYFLLVLCCNTIYAQTVIQEPTQLPTAKYRLFRTNNIWTFIKLDTIAGKMWILQFDVEGDARGSVELNTRDLAGEKEQTPGRFTLYPTSNMYTFILVDQIDGNTWQVQWSYERANRLILPIN